MQWETTRKETVTKREVRKIKTINGQIVDDSYNTTIDRNVENGSSPFNAIEPPSLFRGEIDYDGIPYNEDHRRYEGIPSSNAGSELNYTAKPRRTSFGSDRSSDRESRTERRSGASTPTKKTSVTLQMGSRKTSTSSTSSNRGREKQATYNMSMRLGEVNGSGTDGNVYIQLFGDNGNTAKIQLRQSGDTKNRFESGELYKFTVGTVDIGKVEKIKLTHDHMSYGSGFFVEEVEIDVPQHDEHYQFPCKCWLSQDPQGEYVSKTIQRDLNATPPQPNQRYTVSVKIGEVENPFAKLFVRLIGDKGESSKIVLRPAGSNLEKFENGKVYKFTVEMLGVGEVQKIHLGHDGQDGPHGKGVFIDDVEVETEADEAIFFPCNCWLDDEAGDGKTELVILPGPRPESSLVSENAHTVSVKLGEVHNPNVNLYICLIGTKGETPKVSLRPESLTLERNKTYKFTLAPTMDLGRIEKIRLGQDCRGFGNGLFVEEVEVTPPAGPPVLFPCEVWLAEDVDDGETERDLYPGWTMPKKENTSYYLVFKTGDMPYAGTDANVSLQIFGEKGKTERIMLRQQKGKTLQRFDRGRTDKFTVQTMDVGKVERIRLSHDNQGENPEWYLENLRIEVPSPSGGDDKYYFPCNTWLKGPERDRRVILELYPVSPQQQQKPQTIYTVNFRVGEVSDPRTEFYLVLVGVRGESGKIVLAPDDSGKFVPGQEYRVVLKTDDVGEIRKIEVGQDKGKPLFVEEVEICAADQEPVVFPLSSWVDDTEKDYLPGERQIIAPVTQTDVQAAPPEPDVKPEPEPEPEPKPAMQDYTILYRLGEVSDPRTELYIKLYGDRGESGRLILEPADESGGLQPGKLYKVVVQIEDIGEIQRIHIGHGNRGPGRGVYVEEVEVRPEEGESVIFPCRCWLAEDKDDGKLDRVLIPGESLAPPPDNILYNVTFETGTLPFAGTDANVFIELHGEEGSTGKIEFNRNDNKSAGRFERGRTDKFAVETTDIGKLKKIRVGHDNFGHRPEWNLKQIMIDVPQRNEHYTFLYNNWIAGEDVYLEPVDEKTKGDIYTIAMTLGEVYDPISPIHVQLIGERGESGPIQIKPGFGTNDRFENDKTYKVVAKVVDIGKTTDVIVRQDEASTGVYIECIEITNSRGESTVVPVRNWTSKTQSEERISVGGGGDQEGSARSSKDVVYEIAFKTGDEPNAGTNADVHFQLIGDQGQTESISLRDDSMRHFERGGTDKFRVETKDVGEIKKLRIGCDNRGNSPDWLLEKVTLDDFQRNERYVFNCNSWLLGKDPELEFEPGVAPTTNDQERDIYYNVTITTGDEPNAGTDANVFLQLYGEQGQTELFKLREAGDNKRFSRGRTDKFSIQSKDVGKLNKVLVTRDMQGKEPGWLLERMVIYVPETNEEYIFQCDRWIVENDPEFYFQPGPAKDEVDDNLYTVVVQVEDVMDPKSNPYYQICGTKGKTNKIYLRDGYSHRHAFKKGDTYKISVRCPDVGKVTKLLVADDSGNAGRSMYLEEVTVINDKDDKTLFPSRCWLENDPKGNPIVIELLPGEPASQEGVSYRMIVKTADRANAGTDANVYFQFHGEKGATPKILLQDETGAFKRFERGRADKFIVQTVDVGKLEGMVIGHDNKGEDPSWFLEEVEVDILETGDHYLFRCGRWLRIADGKNETETILFPSPDRSLVDEDNIMIASDDVVGAERDGAMEALEYEVEFKTGEESEAGMDSNVFFQLFGKGGETKKVELQQVGGERRFQKGSMDRFRFKGENIGTLEQIRVGHDGSGKNKQWFLEEVIVYVIERNERYIFKCNQWIGGKNAHCDLSVDSWGFYEMVGREPDIPDLLDYMQSGDITKMIHAAVYLQHLCYQDENVKAKVRELGGIEILVRLLDHSNERVRYAAACVLRNISYSVTTDENKLRIADCGGILALIRMLQRTQEEQERQVILTILRNLSGVQVLKLLILRECLHILVIIILIPYSGWDKVKALRDASVRDREWSAVLEHVTRIIRNLSSAGSDARDYLREEEALVDCLVWIIRVSVRSKYYENRCLENSVCTLRNLSYRLESEVDRDHYKDANLDMDSKSVKEQQSQGCFAGCGGRKKKKTTGQKPIDRQKGAATGVELLWQPTTVGQYYILLKESNNMDTLEGSAGALHNLTACSWNWAIKIRGDSRKAQIIPHLVRLLKRDYDPAIRAAAICLRNLAADPENKKLIGEKSIKDLALRIPAGNEENPLVKEPTIASLMCAIYQLCIRNEKNARILHKTDGVRKIVRIAKSKNTYSPRLVKTANQVLANLWSSRVLTDQIKKEGWEYTDDMSTEYRKAPLDYETTSLPRSPGGRDSRVNTSRGPPNGYAGSKMDSFEKSRRDSDSYQKQRPEEKRNGYGATREYPTRDRLESDDRDQRWAGNNGYVSGSRERMSGTDESSGLGRDRSWGESLNHVPPAYTPQSSFDNPGYESTRKTSRGSSNREELEMEEYEPRSFATSPMRKTSSGSMRRDFNQNQQPVKETPVTVNEQDSLKKKGEGARGKKRNPHLWV